MHRVATAHVMVVGLLVLGPRVVAADDVQSWTEIKLSILASDRIDWSVRGVAGFQDSLGSVYDRRGRTDVEFTFTDRDNAQVHDRIGGIHHPAPRSETDRRPSPPESNTACRRR